MSADRPGRSPRAARPAGARRGQDPVTEPGGSGRGRGSVSGRARPDGPARRGPKATAHTPSRRPTAKAARRVEQRPFAADPLVASSHARPPRRAPARGPRRAVPPAASSPGLSQAPVSRRGGPRQRPRRLPPSAEREPRHRHPRRSAASRPPARSTTPAGSRTDLHDRANRAGRRR